MPQYPRLTLASFLALLAFLMMVIRACSVFILDSSLRVSGMMLADAWSYFRELITSAEPSLLMVNALGMIMIGWVMVYCDSPSTLWMVSVLHSCNSSGKRSGRGRSSF